MRAAARGDLGPDKPPGEARLRDRRAGTPDHIATRPSGRGLHRRFGRASPQGSLAAGGCRLGKPMPRGGRRGLERGPRATAFTPNRAAGGGGGLANGERGVSEWLGVHSPLP